jgi:hypothetical protein
MVRGIGGNLRLRLGFVKGSTLLETSPFNFRSAATVRSVYSNILAASRWLRCAWYTEEWWLVDPSNGVHRYEAGASAIFRRTPFTLDGVSGGTRRDG